MSKTIWWADHLFDLKLKTGDGNEKTNFIFRVLQELVEPKKPENLGQFIKIYET